MLSDRSFSSGEEYAKSIIDLINFSRLEDPESKNEEVYEYWFEEIIEGCKTKYYKYVCGEIDDYKLNETEMMDMYKEAALKMTGDILEKLVKSGDIKMGVDSKGDIVYSTTEQGRNRLKEQTE